MQPLPVAQRVVAADQDQYVDADMLEIPQDLLGDVVGFVFIAGEMRRHSAKWEMTGASTGGVEKCAASSTGAIYLGLR